MLRNRRQSTAARNDTKEMDMLIARVIGTTVSTVKDEKLTGRKLLILRQTDEAGSPAGKPYVAVDTVDAGVGDLVLTCAGSSARQTNITKDTPVDAVVMAVIDSLEVEGKVVFRKS
jgi:microcompartment protein CcmK/EutM